MGWGRCSAGPRAVPGAAAAPAAEGRAGTWAADKGAAKREDRAGCGSSMSAADLNPAADAAPDSGADPGRAAVASAYQRFEPRAYLRNNYAPPRGDLSSLDGVGPWKLRCLAQTFATGEHGETEARRTRSHQGAKGAYARARWGPRSTDR